jgi:protein SCO1/2
MPKIVPTVPSSLRVAFACLSLLLGTLAGCHRAVAPAVAPATQKSFAVRGRVVSIDQSTHEVMLDAETIPGYMEAMTMPYKLAQPDTLSELHPGDRITAQLVVDAAYGNDLSGFSNPRLESIVVVAQAKPDYKPAVQYHVPAPGDAVPDFSLLNQSGRTIHLAQFKGRVLLMTFIFTRCNLPDYCPRMSRNFAEIDHALAADPALYAKTHLLSVSFDPTNDTPTVLRDYGGSYTGRHAAETFAHWDFAAPPEKELPAITQFFNVGITPGENSSLTHSLSTILIGRDGKIVAWFPTNDWQTSDMLARIKAAAA